MDKIIERGLLFDFYGELLTQHQQEVYSEAVFNDLSLAELSESLGVSRQGIHDLIKRVDKQLQEYEDCLHLIEQFKMIKSEVQRIKNATEDESLTDDKKKTIIIEACNKIVEDL